MHITDEDVQEADTPTESRYSSLVRLLAKYVPFQVSDVDPHTIQTAKRVIINTPLGVTPININGVVHYSVSCLHKSRLVFKGLYLDPQQAKNEYVLARLQNMKIAAKDIDNSEHESE